MKDLFQKESNFVRFDAAQSKFRAIFRSVQSEQPIVDRCGNVDYFYGVKFDELYKRARKLRRNGVEPDETIRAINHLGRISVYPNIPD